jgi:hypothetical protein
MSAGERLRDENVAVIAYPNGLGTTTILALNVAEFLSLQGLITTIPDMRCVDVSDATTIDSGIVDVLDKMHERGRYDKWRERMEKMGIDPDATYAS